MRRWARLAGVWAGLFAATLFAGEVGVRVGEGRAAAHPPELAKVAAATVAARIDSQPAAVGQWVRMKTGRGGVVGDWTDALARGTARAYLLAWGETEAASWVGRLDRAEGAVQAVLVFNPEDGVPGLDEPGISNAVFCAPAREPGRWVALFWDGPWADDRFAAAQGLMAVCARHAPLVLQGVPMADNQAASRGSWTARGASA